MKARSTSLPPAPPTAHAVHEIRIPVLVSIFGASESWWWRRRPELLQRRLLVKRGRHYFGRLDDIAAWLLSPDGSARAKHTNRPLRVAGRSIPTRTPRDGRDAVKPSNVIPLPRRRRRSRPVDDAQQGGPDDAA